MDSALKIDAPISHEEIKTPVQMDLESQRIPGVAQAFCAFDEEVLGLIAQRRKNVFDSQSGVLPRRALRYLCKQKRYAGGTSGSSLIMHWDGTGFTGIRG